MSDSKLRQLERKAQSGEKADIAAYWFAALRSGVPKPNMKSYKSYVWTLEPNKDQWTQKRVVALDADMKTEGRLDIFLITFDNNADTFSPTEDNLKKALRALLASEGFAENPRKKRRNADDKLRKLERAAATDYEAAVKLTEYRLKTDPRPTRRFSNVPGDYSGIYEFSNGWTVWYGGNDVFMVLNKLSQPENRGSRVPFPELEFAGLWLSNKLAPGLADGKIVLAEQHQGRTLAGKWLVIKRARGFDFFNVLQDVAAWPQV